MKLIQKSILLTFTLYACLTQCNQFTIKQAQQADLDAINALLQQEYHNYFKPLFAQICPHIAAQESEFENFINERIARHKATNQEFITRQTSQEDYGILVAYATTPENNKQLAGYCRLHKEDTHTAYIDYLIVSEEFRGKGAGKQLVFTATNTFDNITHCSLFAFTEDNAANAFYQKLGFKNIGQEHVDPVTAMTTTDPVSFISLTNYDLEIKR
jgi:N-acetylglutamate synthase-like GNAT family acetyltransferase